MPKTYKERMSDIIEDSSLEYAGAAVGAVGALLGVSLLPGMVSTCAPIAAVAGVYICAGLAGLIGGGLILKAIAMVVATIIHPIIKSIEKRIEEKEN